MAKDEYWKKGQILDTSNAIYDSMQFLSMKREKSMNIYPNDDSQGYFNAKQGKFDFVRQLRNTHSWSI